MLGKLSPLRSASGLCVERTASCIGPVPVEPPQPLTGTHRIEGSWSSPSIWCLSRTSTTMSFFVDKPPVYRGLRRTFRLDALLPPRGGGYPFLTFLTYPPPRLPPSIASHSFNELADPPLHFTPSRRLTLATFVPLFPSHWFLLSFPEPNFTFIVTGFSLRCFGSSVAEL